MPQQQLNIKMPDDLRQILIKQAKKLGVSVSTMAKIAIKNYLDSL